MSKIVKVDIVPNGPVNISGNFTISSFNAEKIVIDGTVKICCCGKSKKLPYCDDSH